MTSATSFPGDDAVDPLADRADWHEPMLKELAEIGMEMARIALRREAAKAVDDETGRDPQLAFVRVSRAVRQIVALNAHLRQPRPVVAAKAAAAPAASFQIEPGTQERVRARLLVLCRRSEVLGRLTAAIEAEAGESDAERLLGDLDRRLDFVANQPGFGDRPIEEIIADIRRDLGLAPRVVAAAKVGGGDDEGPDEDGLGDDGVGEYGGDDDEPGWGAAQSPPRRWSG